MCDRALGGSTACLCRDLPLALYWRIIVCRRLSSSCVIRLTIDLSELFVFFFSSRRRHTRCLSDWSSDVCSSDLAEEEAFDRFVPVEGDVFSIPYPDESFDVVMCQGVLHHTADPFRGLREVVRVCRRGGLVSIFLYNRWNHWRHNLQKDRVTRLAGDDIEERFRVAHRLYGSKPLNRMSPEEIATFYDQYCHPHKSDHTIGETLSWFDRVGLTYWGSYPPLRIRDFVACAQERARLLSEYPLLFSDAGRLTTTIALRLPAAEIVPPPFRRPTLIHRFFWQAVYAWHGRHGTYSGGAMLCGLRR